MSVPTDAAVNNFMGRTVLALILGYALFWAVLIVSRITMPFSLSYALFSHQILPWLLCSVVTWLGLKRFKMPGQSRLPPPDFKVAFKAANIALDTENDQLWIAPTAGKPMVLKRADILGWEHTWVETRNAMGKLFFVKNQLRFRLNSLERPTAAVKFGMANEAAQDWHSRLTTWMNQ
jgi:hypothetical protein